MTLWGRKCREYGLTSSTRGIMGVSNFCTPSGPHSFDHARKQPAGNGGLAYGLGNPQHTSNREDPNLGGGRSPVKRRRATAAPLVSLRERAKP